MSKVDCREQGWEKRQFACNDRIVTAQYAYGKGSRTDRRLPCTITKQCIQRAEKHYRQQCRYFIITFDALDVGWSVSKVCPILCISIVQVRVACVSDTNLASLPDARRMKLIFLHQTLPHRALHTSVNRGRIENKTGNKGMCSSLSHQLAQIPNLPPRL